jgi:3-hydroxyacyl-[acyl-carrier-protein] dehydratase
MKWRMVDRICSWEPEKRITGAKTVSFEEYSMKAAFGGAACLPETLLLESLLQLGSWLIVLSSDFRRMGVVAEVEELCFNGQVGPGQTVAIELVARQYADDGVLLDGTGMVSGQEVLAVHGCLAVPAELSVHADPEDLRVLFSEIHRPSGALRT